MRMAQAVALLTLAGMAQAALPTGAADAPGVALSAAPALVEAALDADAEWAECPRPAHPVTWRPQATFMNGLKQHLLVRHRTTLPPGIGIVDPVKFSREGVLSIDRQTLAGLSLSERPRLSTWHLTFGPYQADEGQAQTFEGPPGSERAVLGRVLQDVMRQLDPAPETYHLTVDLRSAEIKVDNDRELMARARNQTERILRALQRGLMIDDENVRRTARAWGHLNIFNVTAFDLATDLLVPLQTDLNPQGEQFREDRSPWPGANGPHQIRTTWTTRLSRHSSEADCAEIRHVLVYDRKELLQAWRAAALQDPTRPEVPRESVIVTLRMRASTGWPWLIDVREQKGTNLQPVERRTTYQLFDDMPTR